MDERVSFAGMATELWRYTDPGSGHWLAFSPPEMELDGKVHPLVPTTWHARSVETQGSRQIHHWEGPLTDLAGLDLRLRVELQPDEPVVRFSWQLIAHHDWRLTKQTGHDRITYFRCASDRPTVGVDDIRLGSFLHRIHSYRPEVVHLDAQAADAVGPLLMGSMADAAWLLAYEHGSPATHPYLRFTRHPGGWQLEAVQGNYVADQVLESGAIWSSLTFQCALQSGSVEQLTDRYRRYLMYGLAPRPSAREPVMTYNTWFFQEKHRWEHRQNYWDTMTPDRLVAELDVAHQLGVEVFVLDSGWHGTPGSWPVAADRFPTGLDPVIDRARSYGMRLGLWMAPELLSAQDAPAFHDALVQHEGHRALPRPLAGYGGDYHACLLEPRFRQHVLERMRQFCAVWGIRYLKWDFLGLSGCDGVGHGHGTAENSVSERREAYGFQLVRVLSTMAEQLSREFPDLVIELDVTEPGRPIGLAFLEYGRFFLVNNGPYYRNYDIPHSPRENSNLFVWPGPARTWLGRETLAFDTWIPSYLAYMHYLPDGGSPSVRSNLGSVLLGHHAWWGDLLAIPPAHVEFIGAHVAAYHRLRDRLLLAPLHRMGPVSGSPEIYERIHDDGTALLVVFATENTVFHHRLPRSVANPRWLWPGWTVQEASEGSIQIAGTIEAGTAQWGFFGLDEETAESLARLKVIT